MKPSMIFHQYVWIINTLRRKGRLTFEQLNRRWMAEGVADGNPLPRSTFNRHRDAIPYFRLDRRSFRTFTLSARGASTRIIVAEVFQ